MHTYLQSIHPTNTHHSIDRILHLHLRTSVHIRLLRSQRRHLLVQAHSLPSLQRNGDDVSPRLFLVDSVNQQSLLLHLNSPPLAHILLLFLSSNRPEHLPQRYQRGQHQHNRHVRIELIAQKLDRFHLPQQRGERDGRVLRVIQLQQHHKVVAQRELDTAHILRVERQRVDVSMVILQSVCVHKRNSKQKPRPEEANKQVH